MFDLIEKQNATRKRGTAANSAAPVTALYERLSCEDETEHESNSITNQKSLLQAYAQEKGFTNCRHYTDDGYSGGNFERPGWHQLLEDIGAGIVKTVLVKDMSRVGCNYVETGFYEKWKKYQKHYRAWEKLPEAKRGGFNRKYEFKLRQYRQAATVLRRCQDDGEKIDYKGRKAALDYLDKERFMLDYQLEDMKEEVRRLEVVKRELIRENKQRNPEWYAR